MDMCSNLSVLLRGFDAWVVEAKPSCDTASRVLRALQATASQQRSVRQSISSIPVLAREEQFGKPTSSQLQLPLFQPEKFLF